MPASGIDLDMFKSFSTQDSADLGNALHEDPSLLIPPPLTRNERLARSFNEAARGMALIFHNSMAMQGVKERDAQFEKDRQSAVLTKILPAMGEQRAKVAEAQRQDALQKQQDAFEEHRSQALDHAMKELVYEDPATGKVRGLLPQEAEHYVDHTFAHRTDPANNMPELPPNVRARIPEDIEATREAGREKRMDARFDQQNKLQSQRDAAAAAREDKRIADADKRQTEREKAAADKADKAAAAALAKGGKLKEGDAEKLLGVSLGITGESGTNAPPGEKNVSARIAAANSKGDVDEVVKSIGQIFMEHGADMDSKAVALLNTYRKRALKRQEELAAGPLRALGK